MVSAPLERQEVYPTNDARKINNAELKAAVGRSDMKR